MFREKELSPERAVETLTILESLIGWAQAQRARVVAVIDQQFHDEAQKPEILDGHCNPESVSHLRMLMAEGLAATEVGCALRIPERTAKALLRNSIALCQDFPATLEALTWGKINYPPALTIVEEASLLPAAARRAFEAELLGKAPGMTRAKLCRVARRECERLHPETIQDRRAIVVNDRSVQVTPADDGMCWLSAYLPAQTGIGIHNRLTMLARQCQGPDESRTLPQLRADVFSDLLTGRCELPGYSAGPGPESSGESQPQRRFTGPDVLVTIDATTLAGLTDHAGNLEGYGPLGFDVARDIAALAGSFTPLLINGQGDLLAIGRKRRLPTPIVRRWLRVRDETCRFPGCSRSAANCEIDHVVPWAKVQDTHHTNLAHLCRKHHRFKTLARWNVVQERPGWLRWTSPSGLKYSTSPAIDLAPARSSPQQLPRNDPPPF